MALSEVTKTFSVTNKQNDHHSEIESGKGLVIRQGRSRSISELTRADDPVNVVVVGDGVDVGNAAVEGRRPGVGQRALLGPGGRTHNNC